MRLSIALPILLVLSSAQAQTQTPPAPAPAPPALSADDLARRAFDILAGPAWEKARYFSFTFNVDRDGKRVASFPQKWDRFTGDYSVSGTDQQGKKFVIVMNSNTKQGKAWEDGVELTGDKLNEKLTLGYRRFINDTYWLLMPLKMLDPGVHRTFEASRDDACGHTWDLLRLSFDQGVGLTPADVYWAWINRDTGIVDFWDMKLTGSKPEEPPVSAVFHDFRRVGGLLISTRREVRGKNQVVRLDDVQVLPEVPKGTFTAP